MTIKCKAADPSTCRFHSKIELVPKSSEYREKILLLRDQGKTYNEIVSILGCAKSTVSYHLNEGVRKSVLERTSMVRRNQGVIENKIDNFKQIPKTWHFSPNGLNLEPKRFLYHKIYKFQLEEESMANPKRQEGFFTKEELLEKVGDNPACYLTGEPIDLEEGATYSLDHITPRSKGGDNSLENAGLASRRANLAKGDMSVDELIAFCKQVLTHNGYEVNKK